MKKSFIIICALMLNACAVMDWSNAYGTDYCVYPSGILVGVPTALAASAVAAPPVAIGVGVLTGGTMMLNGWGNYGGTDIENCRRSFKKIVLKEENDQRR